ncbi:SLATT domain-containing protein [Gordonia alkanivorans]|uniref:SLATT domain-containing protein n=1 Tax=Gordonia alkanivorans TaxID=84096 RepID=UPI00244D2F26|nr:SLATT domain-containing protein [Gordonia alkanivorans]MDH3006745.1 SLATT domain-containing protein [Gordonia alkanivorans]MDH3014504.1 SLATT domain-containing protein [Gordonia alkanivorans]MDH3041708.1 SLATT domain-containing protein [Gordonia alkanivorans]
MIVDDKRARERLTCIERRAYKTYRARESACSRLGRRARAWNWAIVALSTATTVAAVGMLTDSDMYGPNGSTLLVCVSIFALVVSLAATNMNHSGRSRDMFLNYRKIQRIAVEIEAMKSGKIVTEVMVTAISDRYQEILDESENHTPGDYLRHFSPNLPKDQPFFLGDDVSQFLRRREMLRDTTVTSLPYITLILPVALFVPLFQSLLS